jgi:3-oxoacyl-[acyl-carrier protein] reductase
MDLGLTGKRALVLGASRGLGAAIARTLAVEGATVTAAARGRERIEAWRAEMAPDAAARVIAASVDMADLASVDALLDAVGAVDCLLLNAGGPPPGAAMEQDRAAWLKHFEPMAANLFHVAGRLLPGMIERGWGRILTVASSGVEQPIPNLALSNGIRGAVAGWSKTLAAEVARHGVTVNLILPGRIATQRVEELDSANASKAGKPVEEVAKASAAAIPAGRYGDPQEFADMATFLLSARAGYVTGSMIRVDGGATRGH